MLNDDYKEMLQALQDEDVKFILIGAYALAALGYPRASMDIDIWIMPSLENAEAVMRSLASFGAPLDDIQKSDFETEGTVFQIGVEPRRIDILTTIDGLGFDDAYSRSIVSDIEGMQIHILSKDDMIVNKKASGRYKDLADVEMLNGRVDDMARVGGKS
ncbi:MAG: nucleotidyltransferase [Spirochaetaceae bacterium]|jgi:predicted nucleotidyltransferase|nr:nucleotidyltransferase [Spirochaetaceae bacterium]